MSQPFTVLVVDDEVPLRKAIRTSLSASGYIVDEAGTGNEALLAVQDRQFDLVLLDANMPGMSGVETCREILARAPRTGIVMVTVRDTEEDKINALEAGADDYVTKPFLFRELIARIGAVIRRTHLEVDREPEVLRIGELKLDLHRQMLLKSGKEIHLSPTEYELLAFLMKRQGAPLMRASILQAIWGPKFGDEQEYLRTYVRMIRKKIEDDPSHPKYIRTEPWIGYRFCDPSDVFPRHYSREEE